MKVLRIKLSVLAIIGGVLASLNFARAQISTNIMSVVAQARVLAAEEPFLPQTVPEMATGPSAEYPPGTYWGLQNCRLRQEREI